MIILFSSEIQIVPKRFRVTDIKSGILWQRYSNHLSLKVHHIVRFILEIFAYYFTLLKLNETNKTDKGLYQKC